MRLVDLDPEFLVNASADGQRFRRSTDGRSAQGIIFRCPTPGHGECVLVWFARPLDGSPPAGPEHTPAPRWQHSGETFDALTLSPSVNVIGDWHGWIRAGEVTTC
jgi:hypothetical protein